MIEIYGTQQDAFVQLVLDQINLQEGDNAAENITNILGTLDASTNKYWTLSEDETLIFVKDVMETNRYKGFTTATYYVSDSAKEFLEQLSVNRVVHKTILIDDAEYIASGVAFEYNGASFQICLVTNPDVILDHNAYLNAKVNLTAMIVVVLAVFLVFLVMLTAYNIQKQSQLADKEDECLELRETIEKLNRRNIDKAFYDVSRNVFSGDAFEMLMNKLSDRKISPVTVLDVETKDNEMFDSFLECSNTALGDNVFRFNMKNGVIRLVFVGIDNETANTELAELIKRGGFGVDNVDNEQKEMGQNG